MAVTVAAGEVRIRHGMREVAVHMASGAWTINCSRWRSQSC
ncbi:hypothetical protein [Bradyrhizobium sp. UFLA05-153]